MMAQQPLRILHCFRSPVGGIFRHVRDLVEEHSKAGHDIGILCDSSTGGEYEDSLFDDIRPYLSLGLTRVPIRRSISPSDIATMWDTYKKIKSLRPDVLHGHGAKGGVLARLAGSALRVNRYRVARLYTAHGGSLHYSRSSLSGQFVLRMERLQEYFTDALVFICEYERDTYARKVGRPRTKTRLIYNGISERDFETIPTRSDAVHFIYVGMLRDLKGPDLFVDAFAKTERLLGRPLSALMIGDGPDRDRYREMMVERGLGKRIGMLPAMRVHEAFSMAQNLVVPSRAEAMPYIVLEGLGAGKTIIASRVGGIPEVLGADSAALVEPGNSDDLARVMAETLSTPDWHARTMPKPEAVKAVFSSAVMARDVLKLYHELVNPAAGQAMPAAS
ncbi:MULTISPECIES: glycosyltransferase family 4 protein [Rhizobium]|uniref:Glycosyltransferase family 4 protein n=2 Tax=Rhizobium/Agrobacterium group TaxID=227290 RepID=A0A7Y2R2P2_9HYPH|nr:MULTISPECIES: glycosyltransferase family 4 protein [Rhizobium]MBW8787470.1 glycosyltransferase family 4 protein [Rhizobium leguminosarum]MBY5369186.1 glycosyltransferase family 4 protein [Rhizobium leguminosarum]MBY5443780.1 glycosyltransferase family 4 protein [Rhizobium leguminosarum]MBY5450722.1 glycosyltransferase family 4 protein [Rhizobium leguminosarum]NDK50822.1 glycosyltransferase family 4 protein [Rhizobium laguerreae]